MHRPRAFTIAELFTCVACAALLVMSIGAASSNHRDHAYAAICADHMHTFAERFDAYLDEHKGLYPPSYVYPSDEQGNYDLLNQLEQRPFGIAHWSWLVFQSDPDPDELFQCPAMKNGGSPRTNPGLRRADWELNQIDQYGQADTNKLMDKQAPRMSYAGNATIIPHNKFTQQLSGGPRVNVLVAQASIAYPSTTIVLTEFLDNWKALAAPTTDSFTSKSHRPINPFYHLGSGFNEYAASPNNPGFIYGTAGDQQTYGVLSGAHVRDQTNVLDPTSGESQVNAVGRHHPGGSDYINAGDERFEGTANFLFIDGAVRRMNVWRTLENRLWGDRYYSLTGQNAVLNY
jgi:hypothetical protein